MLIIDTTDHFFFLHKFICEAARKQVKWNWCVTRWIELNCIECASHKISLLYLAHFSLILHNLISPFFPALLHERSSELSWFYVHGYEVIYLQLAQNGGYKLALGQTDTEPLRSLERKSNSVHLKEKTKLVMSGVYMLKAGLYSAHS